MTVVFFARLFYPHIGGVEKHVYEISKELLKKKYKVIVVTEKHGKELLEHEAYKGIEIYRIPVNQNGRLKKFSIWWWLVKKINIIKQADIVHCHDVFFWYLPFRFAFLHKKVFTTFHGYESFPITKKAILIRKISEKLSRGNICIGNYIKKWYKTKPSFVSYGGVDVGEYPISKKRNVNALFIGRLDEQTGIQMYCNAIKKIKKNIPNFEFVIIGDGKFRSYAERYGKVLGLQNRPEKYFLKYRYAFVSRYLSILEAIAARRLVFAVYDNLLKEDYLKMAPFAKFIVIERTAENLAKKVAYYLQHPEEENKLIEKAYDWVKKQSWEEMVSIYTKLWKKKK